MLVPLVADDEFEYHQPCVFSNITLVSELQNTNALRSMFVTLSGIVILVSELHPQNA